MEEKYRKHWYKFVCWCWATTGLGFRMQGKDWSLISNLYSYVCDAADAFTQLAFKLHSPERQKLLLSLYAHRDEV